MKFTSPLFFLFVLLQITINAQSLKYSGPNYFDITEVDFVGATNGIISYETTPNGMAFGDGGTKFYVVGSSSNFISQFNLTTPYDLSTMSHLDKNYFIESSVDNNPEDITFNASGSKMYITGEDDADITEFDLPINWDVSSAIINDTFDISAAIFAYNGLSGTNPHGITFNNDGSKLYVLERDTDKVYAFNLTTVYDVSSASSTGVVDLDVSSQERNPRGLAFNNDGSELYVIGMTGDDINTYTFPSGSEFNLSLASYSSNFSIQTHEKEPQEVIFNDIGSKFYVIGTDGIDVDEYTLSTNFDFTSTVTYLDSYKIETIEKTTHDVLFNADGTKMYVAGDILDSVSQFSLSTPYDISTITFEDALSISSQETFIRGIQFNNIGDRFYIIGSQSDDVGEYAVSIPFDLSSTVTHLGSYDVNSDDSNPSSFTFNNDGSLLFVLGNTTDRVIVYALSTNYDLSGIASGAIGSFSVNVDDNEPTGLAFNNDGTKFFITGDEFKKVFEYTLITPFDLISRTPILTNEYLISSIENRPTGITFNNTGSKTYLVGLQSDNINEFNLTKGFLPEVAVTNNGTISASNPLVVTISGDTFADIDGDNLLDETTEFTITNLPEGLTPVFTLSDGDTVATLSFIGVAKSHLDTDDVADLVFNFTDAAFTSSSAATVTNAVAFSGFVGVNFISCYNDIIYNGTWSGGSGASGQPTVADVTKGIRIQSDVTLNEDVDCFCLNVESGNTLSVTTGLELNVSNSLELIGDIRLLGTSQLNQTHTGVKNASGSGNLYKDVKGNLSNVYQTSYWSSPVTTDGETYNIKGVLKDGTTPLAATGTPLDITFTDNYNGDNSTSPITLSRRWLAKFVNNNDWTRQINESTTLLNPVEGFTKKSTGNATGQNYTFVGRPNDGDYNSEIAAYGSGTWSVLGNPYPTPINADTFITDNSGVIVGTLYFYDSGDDTSHVRGEYLGGYATRTSGIGAPASGIGGIGTKTPNQNIDIGQGFFVEASASGGTISFNNAQRVFDVSGAATEVFHKNKDVSKKTSFPILRIGFEFLLTDQTYHRQVSIGFRGLTAEYEDGYEAEMWDYKSTDMALEIEGKDLPYAITGIEDFNQSLVIPLKVQTNLNRDVTFKIDDMTDIDSDVYLYDSVTQDYFDITSKNAIVNLDSGVYDNRFFITFNKTTLGLEINTTNKFTVKKQDKDLVISSKEILDEVQIYNLLGQNVVSKKNTLKQSEIKMNTTNFKKGIYIIRVRNSNGSFSKKISVY
ncbi:beta-propeller fold lactonase family protein [Polaribacter sp. AHE13PA]|uniref:beta-propeller fold lactonase family protein n=1 Tax=Polaribacter sp. AHE13PA TaxID=2745562 RepID=UPI001C4FC713|nr:beta-propeller fold lactonase family protein [Polaribacter sp. AHE13PA]QXP68279.1 beta-propeller fold lactonase family protein [Polaribacter sp. AHE13PA]